jgi:hypothetical protein
VALPRSLVRSARSARRSAEDRNRAARCAVWLRGHWQIATGPWSVIWPAVLAFAGVWFAPPHFAIGRLQTAKGASPFLTTVWQVEAVALALSAAVVIFGFQSFSASQHAQSPGSLRAFAEDSGLFVVLGVGIGGLLLPGFVLLGYGRGAPGGWAATWASAFCGLGLALIPLVFVLTVLSVDPRRLDKRRNRRLRRVIHHAVQQEVLERVAANLADRLCKERYMTYLPLSVPEVADGYRLVEAQRGGTVRNISLRRLDALAGSSPGEAQGSPRAYLLTRIGATVHPGSPIAVLPSAVTRDPSNEDRIASYRRATPEDALAPHVAQLHEEAMQAIREQRVGAYQRASTAYIETLLALPEAWAGYHQRFTKEVASGVGPFELGILAEIERHLFEEMRTAMLSGNREIARSAAGLPFGVAAKAVPLGALELSKRMLDLQRALYVTSLTIDGDDSIRAVAESWRDGVFTFTEYVAVPQLTRQGSSASALPWDEVAELLRMTEGQINEVLKAVIDADDPDSALALDDRWSTVLQFWHPEHEGPDEQAIDRMATQLGETDPRVQSARRQLAGSLPQIRLREEVDDGRNNYRLGLAMWALRRLRQSDGDSDRRARVFRVFARHFNQVEILVTTTGRSLTLSFEGGPWRPWLLFNDVDQSTDTRGGFYAGPDTYFIRCFLVLLVLITDPGAGTPALPAQEWLKHGGMQQALDELAADSELWTHLGTDSVAERIVQVRAALDEVVRRRRADEERELADADVDPAKTSEFIQRVRDGWEDGRVAPHLFRSFDAYTTDTTGAPAGHPLGGVDQLVPKDLFTDDPRLANDLTIAFDLGLRATQMEMTRLLAELAGTPEFSSDQPTLADALHDAIVALRGEGYHPAVVIAPVDWELWRDAGFDAAAAIGASPDTPLPFDLPERARHWLRGTVGGLPLLTWPNAPADAVTVLDVARFGRWRQWSADDNHELSVELTFYDYDTAISVAAEDTDLLADADHRTVEERATKLRGQGRLRATEAWAIEVEDVRAARRILRPGLSEPPGVEP